MSRNGAVLEWFKEWTTLCGGSAGATYRSPWHEVTDFNRIDGTINAPAITGGSPTAQLIGSSDMREEVDLGSPTAITEGPPPVSFNTSNPPQYICLDVFVPAGETITFWAKGVARNT